MGLPTSCSPIFAPIKRTEPYGPLRGGEPKPCGHWMLPFSYGNREPWICGDGWVDRYASCGIHLLFSICSTAHFAPQQDITNDHRWSFYGIITEKSQLVNNYFCRDAPTGNLLRPRIKSQGIHLEPGNAQCKKRIRRGVHCTISGRSMIAPTFNSYLLSIVHCQSPCLAARDFSSGEGFKRALYFVYMTA